MSEFAGWVGDVLSLQLAHVGDPAPAGVDVTLGLVLVATLLFALGLGVFKRARGRG